MGKFKRDKDLEREENIALLAQTIGRSDLSNEKLYHDGPSHGGHAINRLTFSSGFSVVKHGVNHSIEHHHLWRLKKAISTEESWNSFEPYWRAQAESDDPSILVALGKAFGLHFLLAVCLQILYAATQYALPILMPYIITWFIYNKFLPTWWMYLYTVAIFASGMLGSLLLYHTQITAWHLGLRIRAALTTLIYRKALYIVPNRTQSSGLIVNLMSTDCQTLLDTMFWFIQGVVSPIQIAVTIGLLSRHIGGFAPISLAVSFLATPVVGYFAGGIAFFQEHLQRAADNRVKLVREFLTAIRIVKYYAWEKPFVANIDKNREIELSRVKGLLFSRAMLIWTLQIVPGLGIGFTFFFYALKNTLRFEAVFSALTFLNMLRIPFVYLPVMFSFASTYIVALRRIQSFALRTELEKRVVDPDPEGRGGMYIKNGTFSWETETSLAEAKEFDLTQKEASDRINVILASDPKAKKEMEKVLKQTIREREAREKERYAAQKRLKLIRKMREDGVEINDDGEDMTTGEILVPPLQVTGPEVRKPSRSLKNVSLDVQKGKLTMVVGSVGSGKSTIGMAFLGEVNKVKGELWVSSEIAYAAQEAWILNATIRDNITFGKPYDPDWYADVIRACALTTDLQLFPASDLTEIGERGTNLSGGQRQRINVARAMYSNSPIVILDDPFSAVDAHVGDHMFTHVAQAMRDAGRTVLLITNQLHFVPNADYVAVLKKGKMVEQGTYNELMKIHNGVLATLIGEHSQSKESDDADYEANEAREKMKKSKNVVFKPTPEMDYENAMKGALIKEEERERGNIGFGVYWRYLKAGGLYFMLCIIIAHCIATAFRVASGVWLTWWSDPTNARGFTKGEYLGGYMGLIIGESLFTCLVTNVFVYFSLSAARTLHKGILHTVSRAPTGWYDTTPIGRVLNRFSKDMSLIDNLLPQQIENTVFLLFQLVTVFANLAVGSAFTLIIIAIGMICYSIMTYFYRKTSIQIQRLDSMSRAPIFGHFTETLEGAVTIRAYNLAEAFKSSNMNKIDANTVDFVALRYCAMFFGLNLDVVGNLILGFTFIALILVRTYAPNFVSVGYMILALSFSGSITQTLGAVSTSLTEAETKMHSAERVMQYNSLPEEAPAQIEETQPEPEWPAQGEIVIDDLSVEYKKGHPVLKHLSCKIKPKEKIGIVGRTGAGKSTLITALFRTIEPVTGTIIIDGVDITKIGLFDLRSKLSIIPQMPQLFLGNVRYNLDPFDEHTDEELWSALKMVKLKSHVKSLEGHLYAPVEEGGSNFSVGQRQLLSMARCLLRGTHVLLLDEATAAVDIETDALLQSMIRKNFKDKTVLTIAHRLNTIMDSDRIMVLDAGEIVEFDSPKKLLAKKGGVLYGMVEATGPQTSAYLRSIAEGKVTVEEALLKEAQTIEESLDLDDSHKKFARKSLEIEKIMSSSSTSSEEESEEQEESGEQEESEEASSSSSSS